MLEVVRESRRVYRPTITSDAWDHFIESKYRHIEGLDKMSPTTLKKSGVSVVHILVEAGYLSDNRQKLLHLSIFGKRPFGWPDNEILLLMARLALAGKISLQIHTNDLALKSAS